MNANCLCKRSKSLFEPRSNIATGIRGRLGPQMARYILDAEFVAGSAPVFDGDTLAAIFDPDPGVLSAPEDQPGPGADLLEEHLRQQNVIELRRKGMHWMNL